MATVLFQISMFLVSCSTKIHDNFIVEAALGTILVNGQRVFTGDHISIYSQLVTNSSSFCILRSEDVYCIVYSNTTIQFDGHHDNYFSILLHNGIFDILSTKNLPLMCTAGAYRYDGEISIARFIATTNCGELWIKNGDGTIYLSRTNESKHIDNNKKVIVYESYYITDLTPIEDNELQRLHFITQLKNDKNISSDISVKFLSPHVPYLIARGNTNFEEMIQYRILEHNKGLLQKIILKNKKVIKGYVQARGKELEITMPKGIVHIPQNQVQHVLQYNPLEDEQ